MQAIANSRSRNRPSGTIGSRARRSMPNISSSMPSAPPSSSAHPQRLPPVAQLEQAEQQQHHPAGQCRGAPEVHRHSRRVRRAGTVRHHAGNHRQRHQAGHDVNQKNPLPADAVHQNAADQRAEHRGKAPHARKQSLDPRALLERVDIADDDKRQRQQTARPEPLDRPEHDKLVHRLCQAAQQRADQEQRHRNDIELAPAVEIGQLSIQWNAGRRSQHKAEKTQLYEARSPSCATIEGIAVATTVASSEAISRLSITPMVMNVTWRLGKFSISAF